MPPGAPSSLVCERAVGLPLALVRGSASSLLARTRNLPNYRVDSSVVNVLRTVKSWRYLLKYHA